MHVKEQQEEAFPDGEALWEMTMTARWSAALARAQSHRSWARQAELVVVVGVTKQSRLQIQNDER